MDRIAKLALQPALRGEAALLAILDVVANPTALAAELDRLETARTAANAAISEANAVIARAADIEQRAAELDKRETDLLRREQAVAQARAELSAFLGSLANPSR